ncbi:PucR family transcriptional regulator [Leucobacter insecticola]|uniref:PucR family transcriptional regulator n=1 Tax=Leucobacter insecticola TaxID=2714934 RepID=UPI001FCC773C|nr:PucR family transcriptional regulator [Leucobacter insecticola]
MSSPISPNEQRETITLGELLLALGPDTATLLGSGDTTRAIGGTDFFEALEDLRGDPETLLLVPSTTEMPFARLSSLAERAAQLGYSGLAVKCRESDTASYTAISESSGLAIIQVSERLSWRLFDAYVAHLLGEQHHSEDTHLNRGIEPLFALANELAEYFGGSVAIEDLGRRIIAYSSVPGQLIDALRTQGILTRRVPDSPFNDDQYRTVLRSEEPLKYPRLDGEVPRIACAIRAGALPLGTIWAIDASGEAPLTEEQSRRIRAAATVAASHMLDDIRVRRATQIPRENRLRTLLEGREVIGSELAELGISEERGAALLAFAHGRHDPAVAPEQLCSAVQRHLAIHRPEAIAVVRNSRVYALVADDPTRPAAGLASPLLPILDRLIGPG